MRVFFLFFMLGISVCFSNNSYSQSTKISLNLKNKTVKQVFSEIEKNSEFIFFYQDDILDVNRKVTVNTDNGTIEQILDEVLSATGNTYFVSDRSIYIIKKTSDTIVYEEDIVQPQKKQVTGTVTDKEGEAVIGANIVEKGTTNGTVTDVDGKFSLNVEDDAILHISYIGYISQDINTAGKTVVDIVLVEDTRALEEMVVVGYGVQKKRDLTGAVSSVKLSDAPVITLSTVSHALAGKAAGLRVTQNSAQVGGAATFRIRGETSTGAGNAPLVIIDGFPVSSMGDASVGSFYNDAVGTDNILGSLNPNDIESIEVLKDASATAIYGSRAGHGVIIVTTKRGKVGEKIKVQYSGSTSIKKIKNDYRLLNADQYIKVFENRLKEQFLADNGLNIYTGYRPATGKTLADFNPLDNSNYKTVYNIYKANGGVNTDWIDEISQTGIQHSHNLSMTAGSERTQYYATINYFNEQGILKNNALQRITANLNIDQQVSKYVKAGLSFNVSSNSYDNASLSTVGEEGFGPLGAALSFKPILPVYDENGDFSLDPIKDDLPNPVALLDIADKTDKERLLGQAYLQVSPIKELTLKVNLGADRKYQKRKQYVPSYVGTGRASHGEAYIWQGDNKDYLFDLTATYSKEFGNHNLTALVGYSYQQFNSEGSSLGSKNFSIDGYLYNNVGVGLPSTYTIGSWASKNSLGSYFSRLNYSYLGRYLLTVTVRADGDSDFTPENRWGYFPSASIGWRFSDELFMQSLNNILSNGKLRASYGQTGNSNIGYVINDAYGPLDAYWGRYSFGNNEIYNSIITTKLGNPDITWETTTEFNIGLDLGFFNNRINLTAEYYNRVISDLLSWKSLPSYNEVSGISANIGKTQGKGYEITLNTVNVKNKDIEWTTDLTLSHYEDRWKERAPDWTPAVYQTETDPIRSIFVYKSDGLLQPGEVVPAWQQTLLPGQIKVKNLADERDDNGNIVAENVIDQYDRVYLGTSDPALLLGFNNTVKWKQLDFNIYFYGELNRWRGASYYESSLGSTHYNASTGAFETWRHDNTGASFPSILANTLPGTTDFWYKKISYLRCRNITMGYTFASYKFNISKVRVYVDVNNPFIFTNWKGIDPETDTYSYAHPSVTSFSIGLDISF